jgi:hypothetical protein
MKALLLVKFNLDIELEKHQKLLDARQTKLDAAVQTFRTQESHSNGLEYCRPGNYILCKFGLCRIRHYRASDKMLLVTLNFGIPAAKAYMYAPEFVYQDRARQHAEQLLMVTEEANMKRLVAHENVLIRKELYLMRREEVGLKEFYDLADFGDLQEQIVSNAVTNAVNDNYVVLQSKQYKKLHKVELKEEVANRIVKHNDKIKNYKGRRLEKPVPLSTWAIHKLKKTCSLELQCRFLAEVRICLVLLVQTNFIR